MEAQKDMSESVASLAIQLKRVRVTAGARIDQVDNPDFSHHLPAAKGQQRKLVEAAAAAVAAAEQVSTASELCLTEEQAGAVVDEALVALMNDLMLSESRESLFGVSVPDFEVATCQPDGDDEGSWHDDAMGLLVYRAWQLLTRTPRGRMILVMADESVGAPQPDHDSYKAVHAAITKPLYTGCIVDFFERCVLALPVQSWGTGESYNQPQLTPKERGSLLAALRHGELDWRAVSHRELSNQTARTRMLSNQTART